MARWQHRRQSQQNLEQPPGRSRPHGSKKRISWLDHSSRRGSSLSADFDSNIGSRMPEEAAGSADADGIPLEHEIQLLQDEIRAEVLGVSGGAGISSRLPALHAGQQLQGQDLMNMELKLLEERLWAEVAASLRQVKLQHTGRFAGEASQGSGAVPELDGQAELAASSADPELRVLDPEMEEQRELAALRIQSRVRGAKARDHARRERKWLHKKEQEAADRERHRWDEEREAGAREHQLRQQEIERLEEEKHKIQHAREEDEAKSSRMKAERSEFRRRERDAREEEFRQRMEEQRQRAAEEHEKDREKLEEERRRYAEEREQEAERRRREKEEMDREMLRLREAAQRERLELQAAMEEKRRQMQEEAQKEMDKKLGELEQQAAKEHELLEESMTKVKSAARTKEEKKRAEEEIQKMKEEQEKMKQKHEREMKLLHEKEKRLMQKKVQEEKAKLQKHMREEETRREEKAQEAREAAERAEKQRREHERQEREEEERRKREEMEWQKRSAEIAQKKEELERRALEARRQQAAATIQQKYRSSIQMRPQGDVIAPGTVLRCTDEEMGFAEIYESPASSNVIGEVKKNEEVTASGYPQEVDGSTMVPIKPKGAVELILFQVKKDTSIGEYSSPSRSRALSPLRSPSRRYEFHAAGLDSYYVDNSLLKAPTKGLGYRLSKRLENRSEDGALAFWGSTVRGIDENDGWLRIPASPQSRPGAGADYFLPMKAQGFPVLVKVDDDSTRRKSDAVTLVQSWWRGYSTRLDLMAQGVGSGTSDGTALQDITFGDAEQFQKQLVRNWAVYRPPGTLEENDEDSLVAAVLQEKQRVLGMRQRIAHQEQEVARLEQLMVLAQDANPLEVQCAACDARVAKRQTLSSALATVVEALLVHRDPVVILPQVTEALVETAHLNPQLAELAAYLADVALQAPLPVNTLSNRRFW